MTTKRKKFKIRKKPEKPERESIKGSLPGYLSLHTDFDKKSHKVSKDFSEHRDFERFNKEINELLAEHTGTTDPEVNRFFTSYDIKEYLDTLSVNRLFSIFQDIQNILKRWGIEKTALDISMGGSGCCCYDDAPSIQLDIWHEEPDHRYEARLERYETKLERYNKWYENNEDKIKEELTLREEEN